MSWLTYDLLWFFLISCMLNTIASLDSVLHIDLLFFIVSSPLFLFIRLFILFIYVLCWYFSSPRMDSDEEAAHSFLVS